MSAEHYVIIPLPVTIPSRTVPSINRFAASTYLTELNKVVGFFAALGQP